VSSQARRANSLLMLARVRKSELPEMAVTNFALAAFAALSGIVLARSLSPAARGVVTLAVLWPTIGQLIYSIGIRLAVVYMVALRDSDRTAVVGSALGAALLSGALLVATGLAILASGCVPADLVGPLVLVLAVSPLALHAGVANGVMQALSLRVWSRLRLVFPVANLIGLLGLWVAGAASALTASMCYAAAVGVQWIMCYYIGVLRSGLTGGKFNWSMVMKLWRYGIWTTLSGTLDLVNTRLDILALGIVATRSELGVYAVAVGMSQLVLPLSAVLAPWILPRLARASKADAEYEASRAVGLTFAISVCCAAPFALLAPWLVRQLLGAEWSSSVASLRILLIGSIFLSLRNVLVSVVNGYGRPRSVAAADACGVVVTLVLLAPMVSALGIEGAAVTSVLAYGVGVLFLARAWRVHSRHAVNL
jgi:O-antigen/teichoic acid export membrane protein